MMDDDERMAAVEQEDRGQHFRDSYTPFPAERSGTSATSAEGQTFTQQPDQTRASQRTMQVSSSPGYSMAQLSFLPATQTTVVTTTTTTTVNCPPIVMKEPQYLTGLDPKLYPLASSPTPALIKKFEFQLGGQRAAFEEAEDAAVASEQLRRQNQEMLRNDGVIRSVKRLKTNEASKDRWASQTPPISAAYLQNRYLTATPYLGGESSRATMPHNPRRQFSRTQSGGRSSRLQVVQTSTPITPSVADNEEDEMRDDFGDNSSHSPTLRQTDQNGPQVDKADAMERSDSFDSTTSKVDRKNIVQAQSPSTPQVPVSRRPLPLDTTEAQDASLPSPSLSPVTAAANIVAKRGYFDHSDTLVSRSPPNEPADDFADMRHNGGISQATEEPTSLSLSQGYLAPRTAGFSQAVMDIPNMIESFDALPASVKSYVMFQFLRRCEKPVLQFVADSVNPALKCDFISLLPVEISCIILGYLDVKSLCRAAQVSSKWRTIIDTSETTWKDLLQRDGFQVPQSELKRAIMEGWGWQMGSKFPSEDWEKDITRLSSHGSNPLPMYSPTCLEDDEGAYEASGPTSDLSLSPARRLSKRKPVAKTRAVSRKLQKRRDIRTDELPHFDATALVRQLTVTDGPHAVATVATMAMPNPSGPEIGLEGLRNMHLYKSLYRRQHLIDSTWMSTKLKPKHLAFKAHERHVVTCLHFDSERILTGSDDTNINVYDTRTGVQRNILRGHDGGVWALKCYGNTLVSGSTDRSVRVWDIEAGKCLHTFHGHTSTVRCLVILLPTVIGHNSDGRAIVSPSQPLIITGSRDSTLRVWRLPQPKDHDTIENMSADDVENYYFVRALTGHTHSVRAIAAHGDTLISGSYDHTVRVWRVSNGEQVHTLRGHNQKVYSVVLDMQRSRCISGSMDNTVKIWSLTDGSLIHSLEGHNSLVGLLDLKGDRLVSAAADSTLRIWDPETGHCKATLSAHTGAITCFQHDSRKVISGSDRTLKMWDTKTGEFVRDLLTDLSGVWQVGFDGRRCVAAVQRESLTYIEILDFGAARDGVPEPKRGIRIEVDQDGNELPSSPGIGGDDMFMALQEVPGNLNIH